MPRNQLKNRESDLVKSVIEYLTLRGWFVYRQNQGSMKVGDRFIRFAAVEGISDVIGMTDRGIYAAVETKKPGKHPEPHQQRFLDRVREKGGFAACVHSLDELIAEIEKQLG